MLQKEFEQKYDVKLKRKDKSILMRLIGLVIPRFDMFFTTYRLPFCKPVITYPKNVNNPMDYMDVMEHELMHVGQFRPWYGPLVCGLAVSILPLPVIFSGRWLIERYPYLNDIKKGRKTIGGAVDTLWFMYGFCWPPCLMRKWFEKKLKAIDRRKMHNV